MNEPRERLILIDWIRLWAFLIIVTYHGSWILWPSKLGPPNPFPTAYWQALNDYSRPFSYSGYTIVFITAFVLGLKPRVFNGKRWLPLFLVGGWIVFSLVLWQREQSRFVIAWDIYPFLIVTFIVSDVVLARMSGLARGVTVAVCAGLLCVPFWSLEPVLPLSDAWKMVLVGICPEDFADWPLLPWSALVLGGVALGQLYRDRPAETNLDIRPWEWLWIAGATFSFVYIAPFYRAAPLGDGWSCYIFRLPQSVFWSYFAGILALIRLAVAPSVQQLLKRHPFGRFPSTLGINRRFFAAYLSHYLFLAGFALLFRDRFAQYPVLYDVAHVSTIIMSEGTARWFSLRRRERS
ncbi:MAG: heparan-alpha-glucosaminide N-acetyltransferase domain-containing protein [Myxococcota bacterium]